MDAIVETRPIPAADSLTVVRYGYGYGYGDGYGDGDG